MNKDQLIAEMDQMIQAAEAEGRDFTAEEQTSFDKLEARVKGLETVAAQRAKIVALRPQGPAANRIERAALTREQSLAAMFPRPAGNTLRIGDMIKAQLGLGGSSLVYAAQNLNTGTQGGFTVPEFLSAEVLDLARPESRVIGAGARTLPVVTATNFATVEGDPTIRNHAENETIAESEILFGSRRFTPYTAVALIRASVELMEDSANFNQLVERTLAAKFAAEIDRRALYGNGVGEQLGIMTQAGVTEIDGSTFDSWGPFSRARQAVAANNYTAGAFITSPGVMGAIDGLVDTTDQPLRRPPSLESAVFLDTNAIPTEEGSPPTSAAVTGDWSQYFIAMRTPITIEATRTGGDSFNRLSVLIRAYARLDSFAVRPGAFARITGIPVPAVS